MPCWRRRSKHARTRPRVRPGRLCRALGRAEVVLGTLAPRSVTASAFGYAESQFRFHEGSAYTRLRDIRPRCGAQEALELCPPADYTDWARTRLDRVTCLAHDGDAPAAVAYATQTMTGLTAGQRQGIIAGRGRELVRALPVRYRAAAAVRELDELLEPACEPKEISGPVINVSPAVPQDAPAPPAAAMHRHVPDGLQSGRSPAGPTWPKCWPCERSWPPTASSPCRHPASTRPRARAGPSARCPTSASSPTPSSSPRCTSGPAPRKS